MLDKNDGNFNKIIKYLKFVTNVIQVIDLKIR